MGAIIDYFYCYYFFFLLNYFAILPSKFHKKSSDNNSLQLSRTLLSILSCSDADNGKCDAEIWRRINLPSCPSNLALRSPIKIIVQHFASIEWRLAVDPLSAHFNSYVECGLIPTTGILYFPTGGHLILKVLLFIHFISSSFPSTCGQNMALLKSSYLDLTVGCHKTRQRSRLR